MLFSVAFLFAGCFGSDKIAEKITEKATEAVLDSIHHLGPMRETPKRLYSWSGETQTSTLPTMV